MLKFRKVVVSGVTGKNGFGTLVKLMRFPEIIELVGLTNRPEQVDKVKALLSDYEETEETHQHVTPIITSDPSAIEGAHVYINWKGVNLKTLQKRNPDLKEEAYKKGMHLRDLLIESNLKIAIEDARLALKYSKHCIYIQQGNPVDPLVRAVHKQGFKQGKVISTGTMMEYYRFTKLFAEEFKEITLKRATGLYIGEHGENAVPVKERILFGGVKVGEYIKTVDSKKLKMVEDIFKKVNTEAFWIREKTGQTPSEGPSSVTADIVRMILNPEKKTIVGVSSYVKNSAYYGLKDIAISLPVILGRDGVENIIEIELSHDTRMLLRKSISHIKEMNKRVDKLI